MKKELKEEKKTESKEKPESKPEDDHRLRRHRCCLMAGLVIVFVIILIAGLRASLGGGTEKPIPSPSSALSYDTSSPTATPASNPSSQSQPENGTESEPTAEPAPASQDNSVAGLSNAQMLDFFAEIVLRDGTGQHSVELCRWTKNPVTIGVAEGNLDSVTSSELDSFISDFNGQSGTVKLQRVNGPGDIKIYYLPQAEITRLHGGAIEGFQESVTGDNCQITEGRVFISSDPSFNADFRKYLIRHETSHNLGFWGHSDICPGNIMGVAHADYSFPECDRKAIQMLYNPNLPLCSTEAQVRAFY